MLLQWILALNTEALLLLIESNEKEDHLRFNGRKCQFPAAGVTHLIVKRCSHLPIP